MRIYRPLPSGPCRSPRLFSVGEGITWSRLVVILLALSGLFIPERCPSAEAPRSLVNATVGGVPSPTLTAELVLAQGVSRPVGFVNDFANVVSADVRAKMEAIAVEVEQKTGSEIVVVTVQTTGGIDIHDYSVELFTRWGIGEKGKDNGLLIVAAIADKKLWIKTGYGLEGTIPDAVASQVYRNVLRPSFGEGDYGKGLLSAVQVFAARIAGQAGVELTSLDGLPAVPREDAYRKDARSFGPLVLVIGVVVLLIIARMTGGPRSGRHGGFPFWTMGGFSGGMKGGSFGGGFGGFGGGSCGGGGAGGGW